ncbi:hypothetical protein HDU67_001286 [Dinochytrium kinnereticum]|nr:hypothetical protein HDU67_001286 [Dinochytrium kinnereticum]
MNGAAPSSSGSTQTATPIVAIYGAGLIGSYLGASLATSPASFPPKVHFIGRPKFMEKIKKANGLTVTIRTNAASVPKTRHADPSQVNPHTSLQAFKESLEVGPEFLAVCVKRTSSVEVARELREAGFSEEVRDREGDGWFWRNTTVITLQNGARAAGFLRDLVGETMDVVEGMWPFNVVEPEEAHFFQASVGPVYVADSDKGRAFMKLLLAAGVDCKVSSEMDNVLYGKLLLNLNNAVSALSGVPLKAELSQRQFRDVLSKCISEALAVYTASGIHPASFTSIPVWMIPYVLSLPDFAFLRIASSMLSIDEKATSSTYEDLKAKRLTEIDYLQGEICRLGIEHNVATPVCDRVVQLIREVEKKGEGIIPYSGEQILDILELL